jgi:hypothetical protein
MDGGKRGVKRKQSESGITAGWRVESPSFPRVSQDDPKGAHGTNNEEGEKSERKRRWLEGAQSTAVTRAMTSVFQVPNPHDMRAVT